MAIEFDPIAKIIKITSGTEINALTIYNAVMDWCDAQENIGYSVPMGAVGKAPLGGGVYSDSIFILQNGWKLKLYDGDYHFIFIGTIITDDGTPRTVNPDSGNVTIEFQVTSQGLIIPDEAEWTQTEKDTIMSDVDAIEVKTGDLPSDPSRESSVERVEETLILHDSDIKGNPVDVDANLRTLKQFIEELVAREAVVEVEPRSVAQALEKKIKA